MVQQQVNTQQIRGSVVQVGSGHKIGQTLNKYRGSGVSITTPQTVRPIAQPVVPIQPARPVLQPAQPIVRQTVQQVVQPSAPVVPTRPVGLFPTVVPEGPTYIAPKVQINETRTINIDGIAANKL